MSDTSDTKFFLNARRFLYPEPPLSLMYAADKQYDGDRSEKQLARYISQNYPDYTYTRPEQKSKIISKHIHGKIQKYFRLTPSISAVSEVVKKYPELSKDFPALSKKISFLFPQYTLMKDESKKHIRNKKKKRRARPTSQEKKVKPKTYVKIIGHPKNYWVIAWKGWSQSYVVNPRGIYSGLPKKYKTKGDAIADCQRGKCVLLEPNEYDKIAPRLPAAKLWALERKNQRPQGTSIYKHAELVAHVATLLPKANKGDHKIAELFLKDIEHIFPNVKELPNIVIVKAVLITKRRGLTAEKTAKELRKMKYGYKGQPSYMKIIYTPM